MITNRWRMLELVIKINFMRLWCWLVFTVGNLLVRLPQEMMQEPLNELVVPAGLFLMFVVGLCIAN